MRYHTQHRRYAATTINSTPLVDGGAAAQEDVTGIRAVLAENVRRAREAAGWSQEELGFEAGLDRTYISQVERGRRNVTIIVLAKLALAMSTTPAVLLTPISDGKRRR